MKLLFSLLLLCSVSYGKTYDCFPFFNEIELLKMRIAELDEVVDYFVLVESIETQRGNPKILYFEENKDQFAAYLHKIIHVIVDERHPEFLLWERENYQRDCIMRGLTTCKDKDIILISDVDEIPRGNYVQNIRNIFKILEINTVGFQLPLYRYHLNCFDSVTRWHGCVSTTYQNLKNHSPQFFREKRADWYTLENAGWHFTWMGGRELVREKMKSVVEGRDDVDELTDEDIDRWIAPCSNIVPIDASFPQYMIDHLAEFTQMGWIAEDST